MVEPWRTRFLLHDPDLKVRSEVKVVMTSSMFSFRGDFATGLPNIR